MQAQILLFFQNHSAPFLDNLAQVVTFFGESTSVLLIGLVIYWCIDKKRGFAIFSSLYTAHIASGVIKSIVRMPRPFTVLPEIKGKRLSTATGYSFPSGHTTTAASFYSSVAMAFRKKALSISCAIMIVLVGLSRMYLGVHWPLDVAAGLILGCTVSSLLFNLFLNVTERQLEKRFLTLSLVIGAFSLVLLGLLWSGKAKAILFSDLMKSSARAFSFWFGSSMEARSVHFRTEGTLPQKVLRYLVGVSGILLIMAMGTLLKGPLSFLGNHLQYTLMGLWMTWTYPLLGQKLGLFPKKG